MFYKLRRKLASHLCPFPGPTLRTANLPLPTVDKVLDVRATLVFTRLQRFYQTFNIIATLLGGPALAILTFDEFHHSQQSAMTHAAAGLLTSAALSAVVAVMVATMLLFRFEGHEKPTRQDLLIAWVPLVLLDLVIVEVLFGLMFRYIDTYICQCPAHEQLCSRLVRNEPDSKASVDTTMKSVLSLCGTHALPALDFCSAIQNSAQFRRYTQRP